MANKNTVTQEQAKGTTNNVGQEIKKQAPSTEVITCTMTDDEHKARIERITSKMEQGLKLSWDIIVDITSAKERNEQELDGYTSSAEDFNKWANELFGMGDTQIKQAVRLVQFYGSIDDKGEYSLDDKFKRYTKEKLDIIQRLLNVKKLTKAGFDEVTEALGIMPSTSEGILKEMVRQAKGLPEKSEETEKKPKEKEVKEPTIKEIKESATYKVLDTKRDTLLKFVQDMCIEANDNKVNDKDFRKHFISKFEEMEKAYNNVGKTEEQK